MVLFYVLGFYSNLSTSATNSGLAKCSAQLAVFFKILLLVLSTLYQVHLHSI